MSRKIDASDPKSLSLDERIYLADRGRLPDGAKMPTAEERAGMSKNNQPDQKIVENSGVAQENSEDYVAAMAALEDAHQEIARLNVEIEESKAKSEEDPEKENLLLQLEQDLQDLRDEAVEAYLTDPITIPEEVSSIEEVKSWVVDGESDTQDRSRATLALRVEREASKPRSSLVEALEKFLSRD